MSYKRFDSDDVIVSAESVTTSAWSGNVTTLSSFYTSSTQYNSTSGDYYINIFNQDPSGSGEEIQFTVGYANKDGKGSLLFNSAVAGKSPSDTIYGQYRTLVLGDEEADFTFGSGDNTFTGTGFYVISVDRGRYKEKRFFLVVLNLLLVKMQVQLYYQIHLLQPLLIHLRMPEEYTN